MKLIQEPQVPHSLPLGSPHSDPGMLSPSQPWQPPLFPPVSDEPRSLPLRSEVPTHTPGASDGLPGHSSSCITGVSSLKSTRVDFTVALPGALKAPGTGQCLQNSSLDGQKNNPATQTARPAHHSQRPCTGQRVPPSQAFALPFRWECQSHSCPGSRLLQPRRKPVTASMPTGVGAGSSDYAPTPTGTSWVLGSLAY